MEMRSNSSRHRGGNQPIRISYIPRMTSLLQDTDYTMNQGVNGWLEYVIVDAAMKAMMKEESDITALAAMKMALIKRIEETATNRDAGLPDTISDVRGAGWTSGGDGGGWYPNAGFMVVPSFPGLMVHNLANHNLTDIIHLSQFGLIQAAAGILGAYALTRFAVSFALPLVSPGWAINLALPFRSMSRVLSLSVPKKRWSDERTPDYHTGARHKVLLGCSRK